MDQVVTTQEEAVFTVDQVPGDLLHPVPVRGRRDAGDLHATALQVDHEEHEVPNKPSPRHNLDREEICGGDRAPMGSQEGLPCHWTPSNRIDSVFSEHALDCVSANLVAEVHQRTANACVSPTRILESHPNDEALDLALDSRAAWPPFGTSIVLLRDQITIPAEQRVGCDDGRDVSESATT